MKKQPRHSLPPPMPPFEPHGSSGVSCNWYKQTQECIRSVKRHLRSFGIQSPDMSEAILRRRTQAVVGYTDRVIDRYKTIPGLEEAQKAETGNFWINLNFVPTLSYNAIEETSHILFAAAIWILDQITGQPDWQRKLFPLLPREPSVLNDLSAPEVWDPAYDYDLILSVMYILNYRNIDVAPMELREDETEHVLTTSINARGEQHANVPSRKTYEALIGLIPADALGRAAKNFESLLWAWTDRYFSCIAPISVASTAVLEKINQIGNRYNELREEFGKALEGTEKTEEAKNKRLQQMKQRKPSHGPLNVAPAAGIDELLGKPSPFRSPIIGTVNLSSFFDGDDGSAQRALKLADQLAAAAEEHKKAVDRYEELVEKKMSFTVSMIQQGCIRRRECKEKYGEETAAVMEPLLISDPYEICFALLWLIESGSDLPWLYGPGCGMMQEVVESLPWGVIEYDESDNPVWSPEVVDAPEQILSGIQEKQHVPAQRSPILDWYERKYAPKGEDELFAFNRSLAQILYEETGCLMPRGMHKYADRLRAIKGYGVRGKDSMALLYLFSALSQARRQTSALNLRDGGELVYGDRSTENQTERPPTYDELNERLKQVLEDNKRLRTSLHESERSAHEIKKELSTIRDTAVLEHRELADLREYVFNRQSASEQEPPEEVGSDAAFPYEVGRNTVVFGGHETWLKAIRPMLTGNIRFIDKDMKNFDISIIRNADILWIQPNAVSHNQYYRIIDAARLYRKSVRYFTYASAAKSASQVMNEDK